MLSRRELVAGGLSLLPGVALAGSSSTEQDQVDTALILMTDVSRSVSNEDYGFMRDAIQSAFLSKQMGLMLRNTSFAVCYAEFNDISRAYGWSVIRTAEDAEAFALSLYEVVRIPPGATHIPQAIDYSVQHFQTLPIPAGRLILDIAGDGPDNSWTTPAKLTQARDRAVAAGVTINGLPIQPTPTENGDNISLEALVDYYTSFLAGGVGCFVEPCISFKAADIAITRKIGRELV
jgi:Protein of unknown function (DUF1194)